MIRLTLLICLLCGVVRATLAQEWRGLTVLKSNCDDVKQSLKVDKCEFPTSVYQLLDETVSIGFVSCPCPISCSTSYLGYNLPVDTVISITLELKKPLPINDFAVATDRWTKTTTDMIGQTIYNDHEKGITLYANEAEVYRIRYYPPVERNQHLLCPKCSIITEEAPTNEYRSTWVNGYLDISFEEERTWLDKFAVKLSEHGSDSKGYIVIHGSCRSRRKDLQRRADRAKQYLIATYRIKSKDITIINAGQEKAFGVELHVRNRKFPPPSTASTIYPDN